MISVFLRFLNLSITAGWMLPVVLLLRLCLKKAPRWITCVLWGLVALRLVLPFSIESPISLIPSAQTVVSTDEADGTSPMVDSGVPAIDKPLNEWLQTPAQSPDLQIPSLPATVPDGNTDLTPGIPIPPRCRGYDCDADTNGDACAAYLDDCRLRLAGGHRSDAAV